MVVGDLLLDMEDWEKEKIESMNECLSSFWGRRNRIFLRTYLVVSTWNTFYHHTTCNGSHLLICRRLLATIFNWLHVNKRKMSDLHRSLGIEDRLISSLYYAHYLNSTRFRSLLNFRNWKYKTPNSLIINYEPYLYRLLEDSKMISNKLQVLIFILSLSKFLIAEAGNLDKSTSVKTNEQILLEGDSKSIGNKYPLNQLELEPASSAIFSRSFSLLRTTTTGPGKELVVDSSADKNG